MIVACTDNHRIAAKCELRIEMANTAHSVTDEYEFHSQDIAADLTAASLVVSAAIRRMFGDRYFDFFFRLLEEDASESEGDVDLCKIEILAQALLGKVARCRAELASFTEGAVN